MKPHLILTTFACASLFFTNAPVYAETNQSSDIIKDILQGAMTGAVAAVHGTEDVAEDTVEGTSAVVDEVGKTVGLKKQEEKKKSKTTPYGWSQGKKKGWKGSSTPPGLSKKMENSNISIKENPEKKSLRRQNWWDSFIQGQKSNSAEDNNYIK